MVAPAANPRPPVTSSRASANDPAAPLARRSPYARWRAATLLLVYVLMAAHIVHWQLAGRTLAPLELHEVMYTAELGIVTAGFLFMALAVVLTGVFGRFFCGWGCHLLALQDLCAWLLQKLGIRQKPIRARVIAWAPFVVMAYMFVWPQLQRITAGRQHPGFRFADDSEAIASFTTTDFWRNLPDPWVAALTFVVCGFLAIWVLGSRGFCTYACPYGAVFRLMDRLAPGKVRLVGTCEQCGTCTKVCSSGIAVHEQIRAYGAVVDSRCMKDLDCVGACPHDAIGFRFGKPAVLQGALPGEVPKAAKFDFTRGEEWLMASVFVLTIGAFRGLYDSVPFLMSVGLGAIAAYASVLCVRLLRGGEVQSGKVLLRTRAGLRPAGRAFAVAAAAFGLLAAHSGVVQFAQWRGEVALVVAGDSKHTAPTRQSAGDRAHGWLAFAERVALCDTVKAKIQLAWATARIGDRDGAERRMAEAVAIDGDAAEPRYWLAGFLAQRGERVAAIEQLRLAVANAPRHAAAHARLGQLLTASGDVDAGKAALARAAQLDARFAADAEAAPGGSDAARR